MQDNKPAFPGLRAALMQIMVAIAKLIRYICYLLMVVGLYKMYTVENNSEAVQMVIFASVLALALHALERKYKKNIL